jgi:catechol 2,3-dioxygenase-like lactoylglutathione lyase family enzyme
MVDEQEKALRFYTNVLGFRKKSDVPVGEYRWITVTSPEGPELALEPNANPAAKAFQDAMFKQGIPLAAFEVSDLAAEFARLSSGGVAFTKPPTPAGPVSLAVFADTCGNFNPAVSEALIVYRRKRNGSCQMVNTDLAGREIATTRVYNVRVEVELSCQFVFPAHVRDVLRYRPLMLVSVLEKLLLGLPVLVLYAANRISVGVLGAGVTGALRSRHSDDASFAYQRTASSGSSTTTTSYFSNSGISTLSSSRFHSSLS